MAWARKNLELFDFVCQFYCISWLKFDLFKVKNDVCIQYNLNFAYCIPTLCVPSKPAEFCKPKGGCHPQLFKPFRMFHKLAKGSKNRFSKCNLQQIFVPNYKAQSFLPKLFKLCPCGKNWPATKVTTLHWIEEKLWTSSSPNPLMEIWPNSTGMILGCSPTQIVQTVLIGCISKSQGQKIAFQNAVFKNLVPND